MDDRNTEKPANSRRTLVWHAKWILACYAAAFGIFLLLTVTSLPFGGGAFADWWMSTQGNLAMLATGAALAPFLYRRLS